MCTFFVNNFISIILSSSVCFICTFRCLIVNFNHCPEQLLPNYSFKQISYTRYTDTILLIYSYDYITVQTFVIILVSINIRKVSEKIY